MENKITDGRMNIRGIRRTLCNIDALQEEKRRLESEMAVLVDMVQGFGSALFFIFLSRNRDDYGRIQKS